MSPITVIGEPPAVAGSAAATLDHPPSHRIGGAEKAGLKTIEAQIIKGDKRAAILHSVGANATHGQRRGPGDKRKAVTTLLQDEEWSKWSNAEIARRCSVSGMYVGKLRKASTINVYSSESRTYQKEGRVEEMKTGNIGPKKKPKPPKACPNCGSTEFDEDGDCTECREPPADEKPSKQKKAAEPEQEPEKKEARSLA